MMLRNFAMLLTLGVLSLDVFGASSRPFPWPDCRSGVCKDEASVRPFPWPDCRSGVCKDEASVRPFPWPDCRSGVCKD